MSLLELSGLSVRRGRRAVLTAVDLTIGPGEVVGLLGPNGSGKSTLLSAALGLLPASGGRRLGDVPVERLKPAERACRAAYLPQMREIAWPVTVSVLVGLSGAPPAACAEAMRAADVATFADRPATELSGGEQARVLLARALAQGAPLLLADEPLAGLDPAHQLRLMEVLRARAQAGGAVLLALHDLVMAARFCPRLVLLDAGRVVADGPPAEVLTPERLREVFGIAAEFVETGAGLAILPLSRAG